MADKKILIEGIIQDLVSYICEDKGIAIDEAMTVVYSSIVYIKLIDEATGLYRESSAYVYELLKDELADGVLKQKEIWVGKSNFIMGVRLLISFKSFLLK